MYAYIQNDAIAEIRNTLPPTWVEGETSISNFHNLPAADREIYGWHDVVVIDPAYDENTQVKEGPVDAWDGSTATRTYTVRAMTQQELDNRQKLLDERQVRQGVILIGKLTVQLIDKLLADNVIAATDFTPNVRQDFLTLKAAIDRIAD